MKPIVCIIGATATGKTQMSLQLAKKLNEEQLKCEIINFDSLLFYKELNIGTAKPSSKELNSVPHHLINTCSITSPMNASEFEKKAKALIYELHNKNIIPLLVGGSGFYLRALIKGMYPASAPLPEVIDQVANMSQTERRELLEKKDFASYKSIHSNDEYRTSRALEHVLSHQTLFSDLKKKTEINGPYDFTKPQDKSWSVFSINMNVQKENHWKIIEARSSQMLKDGLEQEVRSLLEQGFSPHLSPLGSIGYKETISYILGDNKEFKSINDLVQRIYINTRRLAKSQKTFFSKIVPQITYDPINSNFEELYPQIKSFLGQLKQS